MGDLNPAPDSGIPQAQDQWAGVDDQSSHPVADRNFVVEVWEIGIEDLLDDAVSGVGAADLNVSVFHRCEQGEESAADLVRVDFVDHKQKD